MRGGKRDEFPLQGVVEEALSDGGFASDILSSGEEALALFKGGAKNYRALLTDVNLKGRIDGWEVARQVSASPAFTRIPIRSIERGCRVQVLVRDNNVDQALKVLKKKMQREGIFREMKLRGHYEKPSEKKVREKAEAVRRARKLARKKLQREGLLPMKPKPVFGAGPGAGPPRPR
jgi:small subunit ribosomal protein S21